MPVLTLKTDQPEAEIALYQEDTQTHHKAWQAHRQLAETIHTEIEALLQSAGLGLGDLTGIVCFKGPGSFTGLRIGLSVANALAYGLGMPVVGTMGEDWQAVGVKRLAKGENEVTAMPEYGAPVHITAPRK